MPMDLIAILLAAVIPTAGLLGYGLFRFGRQVRRARHASFVETARVLNLKRTPSGLSGVIDGFQVRISYSEAFHPPRITIDSRKREAGSIPAGFELVYSPEATDNPFQAQSRDFSRRIGIPTFDWMYRIKGKPATVLALLGHEARRLITGSILEIREGSIVAQTGSVENAEELIGPVRGALRLAAELVRAGRDIPAALGRNAREDPVSTVCLRNLHALGDEYPKHPEVQATLRAFLNGRHPELRLYAAKAYGEKGFDTLKDLVSPPVADQEVGAGALTWLEDKFHRQRVLPLVRRAAGTRDGPLRAAALRALGTLVDADSERLAIAALDSESWKVRRAAVDALSSIGTVAAVEPLHELIDHQFLVITLREDEHDFRQAVKQAIYRIKQRQPGAGEGQVTLADDGGEGGEVSLSEEKSRGNLTLPSHDPPQEQ